MTTASTRIVAIGAGLALNLNSALGEASLQTAAQGAVEPEPAPQEPPQDKFKLSLGAGLIYQFDSNIDGGGDFNVARFSSALDAETALSDSLDLSLRFTYGLDLYDFADAAGLASTGAEPWEDIHTAAAGALFTWHASQDVSLFAGPLVQSSRESNADFTDGVTAGGIIGGSYVFSQEFVLGGGLIITSQIEDDVRVTPFVVIHWQVGGRNRVASRTTGNILTRAGVEFVVDAGEGVEFALGVASYFSRFRLDDQGVAPDGVGQDESTPLWMRASFQLNPNVRLEAIAGAVFDGTLRLEDDNGDRIAERDYDISGFIGVFANVTF
jgi:hypothetical protein